MVKQVYKSDIVYVTEDQTEQVFVYRVEDPDSFWVLNSMSDKEKCEECGLTYESREFFDDHPNILWLGHMFQVELGFVTVIETIGYASEDKKCTARKKKEKK